MSIPTRITAIVALLLFLVPMEVYGIDKESEEVHDPIQKGTMELAVLAGLGFSHEIWDGVGDIRFFVLGGRFGIVLSGPRGPGFLRGNLEFAVEVLPLFRVNESGTGIYGFSSTLLFRHFLVPGSRWRPFIAVGVGPLYTRDPIPQDISRLNFTPQIGLGLSYAHNKRFVFYAEVRLHHISNASTKERNPGINSSNLQFGMSLYRW